MKKLILILLAGAFICFSTVSKAQDGVSGQNAAGVGIGFGGGFGGLSVGGYGVSSSPDIVLYFDHGLSTNWTIGGQVGYQSVTWTDNFTDYNSSYVLQNYSESWKWSIISVLVRGTYHFVLSNPKFDPYIGAALGYNSINETYSNNDPYYGNTYGATPTYSYSGVAYGIFVGGRYYFSDHIGIWLQLGYAGYASDFLTFGLAFKF